jgi:hypothetical protein
LSKNQAAADCRDDNVLIGNDNLPEVIAAASAHALMRQLLPSAFPVGRILPADAPRQRPFGNDIGGKRYFGQKMFGFLAP